VPAEAATTRLLSSLEEKKVAIILALNVGKCYQWRKLYNQEWERMWKKL